MPHLHWIGKEKVINHHNDVPYRPLKKEYIYGNPEIANENKIIHGDNLEALKSLLPAYEGRIDCIYIDPPYNTGNEEWVYNDNVNDPKIKKWLGEVVGREGEDLSRHDKWLCMMYPRLKLLNKLLHPNGVLVISISYHEFFNLIQICKEIFDDRQVVCITVQTSGGKPSNGFNYEHEYLLFITPKEFSPNPMLSAGGNIRTPFEGLTLATFTKVQRPNQTYPIFVNVETGSLHSVGLSLQERIDNGSFKGDPIDFKYDYSEAPEGTVAIWPITTKNKECVWRLIPSRLISDWNKGYIKITPNRASASKNKYSIQYLPSGVISKIQNGTLKTLGTEKDVPTLIFGKNETVGGQIPSIWLEKDFHTVKGTTLLDKIFSNRVFNYPKPLDLILEILRASTNDDSIILDSFAGSGTVGHAVLKLNNENENSNRRFILIELMDYAQTITAERVKKAISGYEDGEECIEGLGGGFTYYELGSPLLDNEGHLSEPIDLINFREYLWWAETKFSKSQEFQDYFLGEHQAIGYYAFIDKSGIKPLTYKTLSSINKKHSAYVIYAESCSLSEEFLAKNQITFKKIPDQLPKV